MLTVMNMAYMLANPAGGFLVIALNSRGLFAALWPGAVMQMVATALVAVFMIEPSKRDVEISRELTLREAEEAATEEECPETLNQCTMWNILAGAFFDLIGSNGIFPLALTPLAFNKYYTDFVDAGEDPVMSLISYKWLSVLFVFMILPTVYIGPKLFEKIGSGMSCVLGNLFTGLLTIALLLIGNGPATRSMYIAFVAVMYAGFPLTAISNMSSNPMLDAISPVEMRGYVQGMHGTIMNFSAAIALWVIGFIADAAGTNAALWTTIGFSFGAVLVNLPLTFRKEFGPQKKKQTEPQRPPVPVEDEASASSRDEKGFETIDV